MSYHIEMGNTNRFYELPERILMREDGWYGAYRFYGEPVVDYWYVPERTCHNISSHPSVFECSACGGMCHTTAQRFDMPSFCPNCGARIEICKSLDA